MNLEIHDTQVYEDGGYVYLFMELCSGGELFDVIMQRQDLL